MSVISKVGYESSVSVGMEFHMGPGPLGVLPALIARLPVRTLANGAAPQGGNLEAGDAAVMPERYHPGVQGPLFKDRSV